MPQLIKSLCRYRVFLCHASDQHDLAAELSASLENQGHQVFLDADDLPPAATYVDRIAAAIQRAHLFLFLITPTSVAERRFTLTELQLATKRWKRPAGKVLPVMVVDTPLANVPPYLRPLTILEPKGNLVAEVVHAVEKLRALRCRRFYAPVLVSLIAAALAGWLFWQDPDPLPADDTNATGPGSPARPDDARPELPTGADQFCGPEVENELANLRLRYGRDLGVPQGEAIPKQVQIQDFEAGKMVWVAPPFNKIFSCSDETPWREFDHQRFELKDQKGYLATLDNEKKRFFFDAGDFLYHWHHENLAADLGWPVVEEEPVDPARVQQFENGWIFGCMPHFRKPGYAYNKRFALILVRGEKCLTDEMRP